MTANTPLEIEHPSMWRLLLHLDSSELTAAFLNTAEDASLHVVRIPLPDGPVLSALEEAVYANPILLSDFKRVDIVVRSQRFMLAPSELGRRGLDALAATFIPEGISSDIYEDTLPAATSDRGITNLWAVGCGDIMNFLSRTFNAPTFHHHLTPLIKYFGRRSELGNSGKLYVSIHHLADDGASRGTLDIVAFGHSGSLELANSIRFECIDDAVYYILAAAAASGLNVTADEILVAGNSPLRASLLESLRRFVSYAMPHIFPSAAFRAGGGAVDIPFPLILIPLCE